LPLVIDEDYGPLQFHEDRVSESWRDGPSDCNSSEQLTGSRKNYRVSFLAFEGWNRMRMPRDSCQPPMEEDSIPICLSGSV
jgi:hypothetical protein